MSNIAIRVENLSKKYKIGASQARYSTFRESISNGLTKTMNRLKGNKPEQDNIIWALKNINFEVKHGEVLGIIGRNGAGKSTLLKILSRITKPTTGRIELNGRVGSLLEVGTGFHPELTGRENIYLNGAILGMKRNEINKKFDEIVDFAEIEKFLDTPAKHYSSGMYMRLAFAVAAHLDPEILVVDEVLSVGDSQFQKKCLGKMGDVVKEGRTVLLVSHQIGVINNLCKNGLLLDKGNITKKGYINNVINFYSSEFNNQITENKRVFDNKKSVKAQLLSVSIQNQDGESSNFDVQDAITISITYKIVEPLSGVAMILKLKRNWDTVFVSFDTDMLPSLYEKREPGIYEAKICLPIPLKAGLYSIDLNIGILNGEGIDIHNDVLLFKVEELSINSSTKSYSLYREGVIAQELLWKTTKTD